MGQDLAGCGRMDLVGLTWWAEWAVTAFSRDRRRTWDPGGRFRRWSAGAPRPRQAMWGALLHGRVTPTERPGPPVATAGWPSAPGCKPWPRSILPARCAPLPDTGSAEILPQSSSTRISPPPACESSGSSCSPDAVWCDRLSQSVCAEPHEASLHDCA